MIDTGILIAQTLIFLIQTVIFIIQLLIAKGIHKHNINTDRERLSKSRLLKLLAENNTREQIQFKTLYDRMLELYRKEKYEKHEILYILGILKTEELVYITVGADRRNTNVDDFTILPRFLTQAYELPSQAPAHTATR